MEEREKRERKTELARGTMEEWIILWRLRGRLWKLEKGFGGSTKCGEGKEESPGRFEIFLSEGMQPLIARGGGEGPGKVREGF